MDMGKIGSNNLITIIYSILDVICKDMEPFHIVDDQILKEKEFWKIFSNFWVIGKFLCWHLAHEK